MDSRSTIDAAFRRFIGGEDSPEIRRDPEYDFIPPLPPAPKAKKGAQCGQCGFKYLYGEPIGYSCPRDNCPAGFGRP